MLTLQLDDTRENLLRRLKAMCPDWEDLNATVRKLVGPANKREVWEEQTVALAICATQFDRPGARILEIGANRGMSACVMKLAAPAANVTTLEPHQKRRRAVRANITRIGVHVRAETSVAFLDVDDHLYDMIFVDGDHTHIRDDLPWYNRLVVGGLFLHHDFSPLGSSRECPPVFTALTEFSRVLDHAPEVLVRDLTGTGLAGWYRRAGEEWDDSLPYLSQD